MGTEQEQSRNRAETKQEQSRNRAGTMAEAARGMSFPPLTCVCVCVCVIHLPALSYWNYPWTLFPIKHWFHDCSQGWHLSGSEIEAGVSWDVNCHLCVCSAPCTPVQDNELQLVITGLQRAFCTEWCFYSHPLSHPFPCIFDLSESFNMDLYPLSPPLFLADICKHITPVLYEMKDQEWGCVHWAMAVMTEMTINDCSRHAQAWL